ncbi:MULTISPECIES: recombination-associated protein RdgC [Giesbergeria]|uniref:Recombination-associated protein RdgC n=1 Tax=Giesbergeria sinuosa TaxID=80883 RepID=A0ABV9QE41_9BURK
MFKNMIIYRIAHPWQTGLDKIEAALAQAPFLPCSATQERSWGWVPPRGEAHGPLAESVGGQWLLRFMTEAKLLPSSVLARKVQEKAAQIEHTTGRKPGKRQSRDLQEEAKLDLLPQAFTRQSSITVWIDPQAHFLLIDSSSQSRADEVVTALVEALPGLSLWLLDTQTAPATAMAQWLSTQEPPSGFSLDRECELKSSNEDKAVVRYARHPLDIDEIRAHIQAGKMPTKLALSWADRLSFVLTEGLQLKKLALLDAALAEQNAEDRGFDTDWALTTGELAPFLPALIEALDGESERSNATPSTKTTTRPDQAVITGPATAPPDTAPAEAPF